MKERTDLLMAIERFEDEINGINEYKEMIEVVKCPDLLKIFSEFLATEKKHATTLLGWINSKAQETLR